MSADKLQELRDRKAEREAKEAGRRRAHELLVLELEDQHSEGGKRRGHDFEIIEEGLDVPIVVKRVAGVVYQKFQRDESSDQSTTEFVLACLAHPKEDEFLAMAAQFPAVRDRAAVAIAALYKAKIKGDAGKY